jgi:thymidylate synthase ThyX
MIALRSEAPRVTLTKAFATPLDNAVATARTCYSSRLITDDDVRKNVPLRDRIASSTYKAGHHTTLQHAHFEFALDAVSRQALWSFFHAHPFYNSEQVSQRYVEVKSGRVLKPDLGDPTLNNRYDACVERQMLTYHALCDQLSPVVERLYFGTFPARRRTPVDKRWTGAMQKRAQEVARYVLPLATHAHLYHTISALTLLRYQRMALAGDCPSEQRLVVDAMVEAVRAHDPGLVDLLLETSLPDDATIDGVTRRRAAADQNDARAFRSEFDSGLGERTARLVAMTPDGAGVLGAAVREVLGLPRQRLSDDDAVRWLLDPKDNAALGESLNLLTLGKPTRALELVQVTFRKKLSHAADSQAQRHRMTPGARPLLTAHVVPGEPDYVLPVIFREPDATAARQVFETEMRATFDDIAFLADRGVPAEAWQYLLPNAVPVRYTETGSLLDQHHKWSTRLCFNAQEEIWRATMDEVEDLAAAAPSLATWILPPCAMRRRADVTPFCPEGDRFCGQPVWQKERSQYLRVL